MFTVRDCITDIYRKMGNLSKSQVDLSVVLSRLHSVINRRMIQLNLSTNNWIVNFIDVDDSGEFRNVVPVTDFSNAVSVELMATAETDDSLGLPIEIVNANNIANVRIDGKRGIAFYQDAETKDWMYVTTFKGFEGYMRIWYEPNQPVPAGIEQNVSLNSIFKDLITSETSYFMMDYVKGMNPQVLMNIKASLKEDWMLWDLEWTEQMQKGRQLKSVTRTPFRAGF